MRNVTSCRKKFRRFSYGTIMGKNRMNLGNAILGNKGVLTEIIFSTVASWIFIKLSKNEKIKIQFCLQFQNLSRFCTLTFFTIFATILYQAQFFGKVALNYLIYALIQAPLMVFLQSIRFSLLYQLIICFFW